MTSPNEHGHHFDIPLEAAYDNSLGGEADETAAVPEDRRRFTDDRPAPPSASANPARYDPGDPRYPTG